MRFHSIPRSGWCRALCALAAAAVLGLNSAPAQTLAVGSNVENIDVRYPLTGFPNDFDIRLYVDDDVKCEDVIWTYNTGNAPQIGAVISRIGWGQAECIDEGISTDPSSPGFGLRCIRLRWAGRVETFFAGRCFHFGYQLRPGRDVKHKEVTWTFDGQPVGQRCDPDIRWVWHHSTRTWVICIANPTSRPIYVWGCRWFVPGLGQPNALQVPLPNLNDLNVGLDPARFDSQWQPMPDIAPGVPFPRVTCIPAWCRVYIRIQIPILVCRPIIFQVAATGTDPGPEPPLVAEPCDPLADMIVTLRPTEQLGADLNANGVVGTDDFGPFRQPFGFRSADLLPPPDDLPTTPLAPPEPPARKTILDRIRR